MSTVITGDIGGTKTRLALANVDGSRVQILHEVTYRSRDYLQFTDLLAQFLTALASAKLEIPAQIALGIAGPVQGRVVSTTNLPWTIAADALQQRYGFSRFILLNDLEATAFGLPALSDEDLLTLQQGSPTAMGNQAIIAAGTGLGEAGLFWDGAQHHPFASEGGHSSFSPADALQFSLLQYLQKSHTHISWERIVSGMGIVSLYEFLREYRQLPAPVWLKTELQTGDAAAVISTAASTRRDEICIETMRLFVCLYGAEAANLALKVMSRGGLYLGGGIAPKILPLLQSPDFLNAFLNKGRMRPLLEAMPIKIILNDRAALYGPALRANSKLAISS